MYTTYINLFTFVRGSPGVMRRISCLGLKRWLLAPSPNDSGKRKFEQGCSAGSFQQSRTGRAG